MHLNIASTYVPDLHPENGFRELFSNAVDEAHRCARQLSSRLPVPVELRMRIVQDTNMVREIEFYASNSHENVVDKLVVASIVGRQYAGGKCVLKLINYYTRLDHDVVLLMGGTTKASDGTLTSVIGKHGEGVKVGALAILRGDTNMRGGSVVYYTAGNRWRFLSPNGHMTAMVQPFKAESRDAPADPSLHTTVVVRCQSSGGNVRALDRMFPRNLYAPLLLLSAATLSAAPTLLFGVHQRRARHDIVNSEALIRFRPDDDGVLGGTLFVNNILVARDNLALPFVDYGDAVLKSELNRDRNQVDVKSLCAQFAKRIAEAMVQKTLVERSVIALFYILAVRMQDKDRKEDEGAPLVITVWDYLFKHAVCRRWFAAEFRQRYPDAYPCTSDNDERMVRDRLGLTPRRVSRCLYRILNVRPLETGFWPVDRAAEEFLLNAPTIESDLPSVAPVVSLVDTCLRLCASDQRVGSVRVHVTRVSAFLLDEHQVLHCPSTLFEPRLTRVSLLTKAFGCVVRLRQIASSMPDCFYETILPLVTSGNFVSEVEQKDDEAKKKQNRCRHHQRNHR